jgi:hypothetical protein
MHSLKNNKKVLRTLMGIYFVLEVLLLHSVLRLVAGMILRGRCE